MPRNNLFKIGIAGAAAGAGAILAITSAFAHSAPSTIGQSPVDAIMSAAQTASSPIFAADPASNALIDEQAQDAEQAAELAAEIAAQQQEIAAEQAQAAAELAAEQAAQTADQQGQDATETEQVDNEQQTAAAATEPQETSGD